MRRARMTIWFVVIVCMMMVVTFASAEFINGINFLSQDYSASVWFEAGKLEGLDDDGMPIWGATQDSYFFSQSEPINYNYTYNHLNVDPFGGDWGPTNVHISHNSGHLYVSAYAGCYAPCDPSLVNGYTTGYWNFQPQYTEMELSFHINVDQGWGASVGGIYLQDLTTGVVLIDQHLDASNYEYYFSYYEPFFSVDPAHTYRLGLTTYGSSYQSEGFLGCDITAVISSIPEPATLLLLGLGGLALLKRK